MARRLSSPIFIGRAEQLEVLRVALAGAASARPGAVLIGGESGVGKTRLVSEFERLALESGARFLIGACIDVGGSELPYAPLLGALRILAGELSPHELEEVVGASRSELGRLLPEFAAATEPASEQTFSAPDALAQSRLFEALLGPLGRAGQAAPVVLVIEDLHWADPSTRGFLSFLLRNVRRERLLLVATYRSDELHRRHPLRAFLTEVERLAIVERLTLAPFTQQELVEQLNTIIGGAVDPEMVEQLFTRSQGNAFYAEELLAATTEGGATGIPASVRDAMTLRLERVSAEARLVMRCAAVAGTVAGHQLLAAITRLSDERLIAALREASEHNVLVPDAVGAGYAFRHALLREALYEELLPHERVALHGVLARALEQDPSLAVGPPGAAAQRAIHWTAAHELAAALDASVAAGIEEEGIWAFAEAMGHFERAVELWQKVPAEQRPAGTELKDLLARAAEAAHLSGDNRRAMTLTRSQLELIDQQHAPLEAAVAHARLGRYLLAEEGAVLQALGQYQFASALLPDDPTSIHASILAGEAHVLMLLGQGLEAREPCEQAIRIARAVGDRGVECDALNTLGGVFVILGDRAQAVELLTQARRLAEQLGALEQLRRAYVNLSEALDQSGRLQEAAEMAREGWEALRRQLGSSALFLAAEAGARYIRLGSLQTAADLLEAANATARRDPFSGMVLATMVELEALRGRLDDADGYLQAARPLLPAHIDWTIVQARAALALALAQGEFEMARQLIGSEWLGTDAAYPVFSIPVLARALAAEAELAQRARAFGDPPSEQEAITRAELLIGHVRAASAAERWPLGAPPQETMLEVELCELEHQRAAGGGGVAARWSALADRWEELGRPVSGAYARLREADAALMEGLSRDRVTRPLVTARATAKSLGAATLLEQIELIARRARVRAGGDENRSSEQSGLTERELEVLRLLAEGRTNREIGATLYMSPKTASVHVSRILSKLDVRSRTEAAGAAYRLGLLEVRSTDLHS